MQLWVKMKEKLKGNIFFQALPFAFLISTLTFLGLFGGYALGKGLESSAAGFVLSVSFSFLGFFAGLLISYTIVKIKYG